MSKHNVSNLSNDVEVGPVSVEINKAELDNALEMLATKEQSWLDSHAE